MIDEWYEDATIKIRVLMRHCAASDCKREFKVNHYRRIYCGDPCRQAEWQRNNKQRPKCPFHGEPNAK